MGFVDIHSHILPGLDDGSESMEESLEMLRLAAQSGIAHMIATPHYKQGRYRASADEVKRRTDQLNRAAKQEGIPVSIYAGTEIFYRSGLEERLDSGELLTLNGTEAVLTEFSPYEEYSYIRNAADELLGLGFRPVIAHAERYQCLFENVERIKEIRSMGARIQINCGSIDGDCGFRTKHFTGQLLKKGLVDYLGTDAHNTGKRSPSMKKCAELLYKKCGREYAEELLFQNAQRDLLAE